MKNHLISVIIPTYNRVDFLSVAIKSVICQCRPNWELIIVDDGSTDSTREEMEKYLHEDKIKYVYQKNQGVSVARNKGVQEAAGEYVIFLDSDDEFFPELLGDLEKINFWNYDLICWNVIKEMGEKKTILKPVNLGKLYNNLRALFLAGGVCYKKTFFLQVGGFDPKISFGENYELGLRVSQLKDLKTKIIDKPLLKYVVNNERRESNSIMNRLHSYIHLYQKHHELYEKDPKAKGIMNYLLGYVMEKTNNPKEALKFYKTSWMSYPWSYKPILKILFLKLNK